MRLDSRLISAFGSLAFDSDTRLFRLEGDGALGELLVEAWSLREALDEPCVLELSTLGLDAGLDLQALLGAKATLRLALADGSLLPRSGIVFAAASEQADGGFARYRLTLKPWTALLAHTRRSRVWQEKTTIEIVESVLAGYAARAQWRWADDVATHLAESPYAGSGERRSYTVQYRETDLAFVTRLLAEEGLGMRLEEDEKAPSGHGLVVFADSPSVASCPQDATSEADGGIRFHRSSAVETRDAVQPSAARATCRRRRRRRWPGTTLPSARSRPACRPTTTSAAKTRRASRPTGRRGPTPTPAPTRRRARRRWRRRRSK